MTVQSTEQGNIVDLGAGGKMNAGIAPTTPSSVDGTIQPNAPAPVPPNQPATTPTTPTTPAAPAANVPAPNRPHPLARALDAVLKSATGGDVYYTDPQGNRQLAPQSRGQLGKTLIAATLAGLLAPDKYRQTPYGPTRDWTGTAGSAMEASQNAFNQRRAQPQKLSDEAQTKKLMTIQNNAHLIALQSASAQLKHENQDKNAAMVETTLAPFKEYESLRTSNNDPNQPKAFISQGLTHDQVIAVGPNGQPAHKLTDSNVIQDGWVSKWNDATNQMEPEPTYAVLNPDLKDVTLPKEVTDMLNKVNSQWKDIHQVVGGTVRVPVNAYVSAMHDYSAVVTGQQILETLNETVNGKDAKPLSVDAVAAAARAGRDKGANILPSLYSLTHAVAGGNLPEDGQRPDNLLHTLLTSPNGDDILKLIGLTPETAMQKADEINAERVKQLSMAKQGGIGDKAPAPQQMIDDTQKALSDLPPADQESFQGQFNPNGTTIGELKHINDKIQQVIQNNKTNAIRAGDPVELAKQASNIIEGDLSSIKDLMNARSSVRSTFNNTLQQAARDRGLDPTRYTVEAQQARADMYKDYSGTSTKTGAQINSFGTLLGHINEGFDASEAWTRSGSPLLNRSLAWLATNATNDQDFKRFQADIIAPAKEYMSFLNANRAEHEQDINSLDAVLNTNQTPAGVITALKSFAKTADIRAANIGQRYTQTVGTTYPVVNPTGAAILNRLLGPGNSQAVAVSQSIPRGWQNGQGTQLTDKRILNTIFQAAGRDPVLATRIGKENGWIIPQQ